MPHEQTEIRYATGEAGRIGDRVRHDVWESVVHDLIATPERMAFWGVSDRGLILKSKESGLVFEPCCSVAWDAIVLESRAV
jgi:hypothetical protein